MKKIEFFFYRLKRRLLTKNITNVIARTNYQQNLNYDYLFNHYKHIINNSNYENNNNKENKTIWICWFQGMENAPKIVKKCYESICKTFKGYEVVVITEDNYNNYVDIPNYIIRKRKNNLITNAHFSDIIRIELLANRGGIWIDSTVYSTSKEVPKYLIENDMFVFKEVNLNRGDVPSIVASSWFMKSNSGNPIILLTRDLIREYWKKHNILLDYFLLHLFFSMATKKYKSIWDNIPTYNNINPHIMQFELKNNYVKERFEYYKSISDFHKLTFKINIDDVSKNSNLNFILGGKNGKNK